VFERPGRPVIARPGQDPFDAFRADRRSSRPVVENAMNQLGPAPIAATAANTTKPIL